MPKKEDRKFYGGVRWKKVRKLAIARDDHLCVICRKHGEVKAGYEVDHIKPYQTNPELAYSLDNLQTLCHNCHTLKTAADYRGGPSFCIHGYPEGSGCKHCSTGE
ncbi:MAG: HNH endonuclease [Gammaproteobacteria bacterium AqS3]|nr:HNH endonuclease [Gammaproteobacteria bacterium AqS3]